MDTTLNTLKAHCSREIGDRDMWTVEDGRNVYRVFDGKYTADRFMKGGRRSNFSIMHGRYAGLRGRIDRAIAEEKQVAAT